MSSALPPFLGGGMPAAERRAKLRALADQPRHTVIPGVYDALTAVIAERAGFECLYLTGAGLANTQLGVPDIGLTTFDAVFAQAVRILSVTRAPLVVDIDTGFGGIPSVMHVVRTLESVGVSAVQLEDQTMPKRCGHFERKSVVSTAEMQQKIDAATRARSSSDMLVIARTDAIAVEGFDSAVARAHAYAEAGADVLFVEAPTHIDQLRALPERLQDRPLLANIVEGGKTPPLSADELGRLGYRFVLYANVTLRAMAWAAEQTLVSLRDLGRTGESGVPFLSWDQRQSLVRLAEFDDIEDELRLRWPDHLVD